MIVRRYGRDRSPGNQQQRPHGAVAARRVERHPLYGDIPLIRETLTGRDGSIHEGWRYDPTFRPKAPRGGVAGDVGRQVFCAAHHVPKYFYVDEPRKCIQCGRMFVFRAAEQKYWYETLKFNFSSLPVRCPTCRRLRRSEHALREQIAAAKADVRQRPADPAAICRWLGPLFTIMSGHDRGISTWPSPRRARLLHSGRRPRSHRCGRAWRMREPAAQQRPDAASSSFWPAPASGRNTRCSHRQRETTLRTFNE
jgi:hypothetical protein